MTNQHAEVGSDRCNSVAQKGSFRAVGLSLFIILGLATHFYFTDRPETGAYPSSSGPASSIKPVTDEQKPIQQQTLEPVKNNRNPINTQVRKNESYPGIGRKTTLKRVQKSSMKQGGQAKHENNEITPANNGQVADRTSSLAKGEVAIEPAITSENAVRNAYVKLSAAGEQLPDNAKGWSCVEDLNTGLVWEVKSAEDGLHNTNNLYSWYEPLEKGEVAGVADGGLCGGSGCDTHAYVHALNAENYCGYSDWRVPTRSEMKTIVMAGNGDAAATINRDYFPQGLASWYWTATSNEKYPGYAWYFLFRNGISLSDFKSRPKHLRLVRSDSAVS